MCTPVFVAAAFAADAQFLVGGVALHLLVLRVRVGAAGAAPWADRHHMVGQHVASTRSAHGRHTVGTRSAHGQHTASARSAHGQHTVSAWSAHGQLTDAAAP